MAWWLPATATEVNASASTTETDNLIPKLRGRGRVRSAITSGDIPEYWRI
jgi:hypothetical protein